MGYTKADKLTEAKALTMLKAYKKEVKTQQSKNIKQADVVLKNNEHISELLKNFNEHDRPMLEKSIQKIYENHILKHYQAELLKVQDYITKQGKKLIIIFEGRDASGKGGAIRTMTRYMNARRFTIVALAKPTTDEKTNGSFKDTQNTFLQVVK